MSRPSVSVSPKILAAGVVFALLAVVIVINLRMWLGGPKSPRSDVVEMGGSELGPPSDLGQVIREVAANQRGEDLGLVTANMNRGAVRDPFVFASNPAPVKSTPTAPRKPRRKRDKPLSCTAIFISGGTHSALVSGRVVTKGDRVKNYRVGEVTDKGVTLIAGDRTKFLPLETKRTGGAVGAPIARGR